MATKTTGKKMGRPRIEDDRLDIQLAVRLTEEDVARLDAIVDKLGGLIPRTAAARQCLLRGVEEFEKDPASLVAHAAKRRK